MGDVRGCDSDIWAALGDGDDGDGEAGLLHVDKCNWQFGDSIPIVGVDAIEGLLS